MPATSMGNYPPTADDLDETTLEEIADEFESDPRVKTVKRLRSGPRLKQIRVELEENEYEG